jgi:hypothetical protein
MKRRRTFYILAGKGLVIERFAGESEEAFSERIGNGEVVGHYVTTACNDREEETCTKGPGCGALEMRNVFMIHRMCAPAAAGKWHLEGGAESSRYSLSFHTKEELVEFLDAMPHDWHDTVHDSRWDQAVSAVKQILNVG